MASITAVEADAPDQLGRVVADRSRRHRTFLRRPTTMLAAVVLAVSGIGTVLLSDTTGAGAAAATAGASVITATAVQREVAAIEAQPAYAAALRGAGTLALAAPVSLKAVAAADGDPDDLRIAVAAPGSADTRAYTVVDLRAAVLTRLLYFAALRQLLVSHHVRPDASELAAGRTEATVDSGQSASGAEYYATLPGWYQRQLALRGADVAALTRTLAGTGVASPQQVQAAYVVRRPTDFTTVCVRSALTDTDADDEAAARRSLTAGGGRDDGCAALDDWAPDVIGAIATTPAGAVASPVQRNGRVALLEVTSRQVAPLSAVIGDVEAVLDARYTDMVTTLVEDQLALDRVTVAPEYGTYEGLGPVHGVLPPDALSPPSAPVAPATSPRQQYDPFD